MKTLIILVLLLVSSFVQAQPFGISFPFYSESPDTQYVLPWERWDIQFGIETENPEHRLIYVNTYGYTSDLIGSGGSFSIHTPFTSDTSESWEFRWQEHAATFQLRWMPNYLEFSRSKLWLYSISELFNLPPGKVLSFYTDITAGEFNGETASLYADKKIVGIDGVRGDVNRDGNIDEADVDLMKRYFDYLNPYSYEGKYTAVGVNYALGRVLFSRPDEVSLALLNLWIHNPEEPALQGLEIGQLYSENTQIKHTSYKFDQQEGTFRLETEGNVVNMYGLTTDNLPWQKTFFVESVYEGEIPADIRDLRIEAVVLPSAVTGIEEKILAPLQFELGQNYPNPFNPSTVIRYSVAMAGHVSLGVYDILGREVAVLVDEEKSAGDYVANFNGSNLSSGTYFYKLSAGNKTEMKKMILMK